MAINRSKVLEAAQRHRRKGNLDRAIGEYRALMEDEPGDMRTLLVLADLYVKTDQTREALGAYKTIAYHYLQDDIYDKAVGVFKQALNLAPRDGSLRRDLGEAYHRMGRLKEAVGEYHLAQRLYEEQGDGSSQRDILERMVRLEPDEPALRIRLAEHYVRSSLIEEAIGLFEHAARQFDEDGRLDDLLKVIERVIYMRPGDLSRRKQAAKHYLDAREPQRALKHLRFCFELSNSDVETLRMMGLAFEQLGDRQKAVLVYAQLGKLYRDLGQVAYSNQTYAHISKLDPNHQDARKMLAYDAEQAERAAAPHQVTTTPRDRAERQPAGEALAQVEFLDEELARELGAPPQPAPAMIPKPQPPRAPQRPVAPRVQDLPQNDLRSFASSTLDDLGDLNLDQIPNFPSGPPDALAEAPVEITDIEPIERDPPVAERDEELVVRQAIDEARVFVKYGLKDRAVSTIKEVMSRHPRSIPAREELAFLYEKYDERVLAADQFVELAAIVRATPARSATYLEQAVRLFGDRAQVEAIARAQGLPFGQESWSDDPSSWLEDEEELMELELLKEADFDQAVAGPHGEVPRDEPLSASVFELSELDIEFEESEAIETGPLHRQTLAALEDLEGLALGTDEVLVEEFNDSDMLLLEGVEELPEDTAHDHRVPIGLGDDITSAREVAALPGPRDEQFGLTAAEADAMFEDLFGEASTGPPGLNTSFNGSQDLDGLAEVDFLLDQGLVSEAEDALAREELARPSSASIRRRRLEVQQLRETPATPEALDPARASPAPPHHLHHDSNDVARAALSHVPTVLGVGANAVNTNFELGAAYMEMELYDEAIEEFRQAMQDPEVAHSAMYNMALCEFNLGRAAMARQRLEQLLERSSLEAAVRSSASSLLDRVG